MVRVIMLIQQIRSFGSPGKESGGHVFLREESLRPSSGHPPVDGADLIYHLYGRAGFYFMGFRSFSYRNRGGIAEPDYTGFYGKSPHMRPDSG